MTRRNLTRGLSLLLGLGIVFIGTRFLLAPRAGAEGFGMFLPPTDTQISGGVLKKRLKPNEKYVRNGYEYTTDAFGPC